MPTDLELMVVRALDMGGTCTGEHGEARGVRRAIKQPVDPNNLGTLGRSADD